MQIYAQQKFFNPLSIGLITSLVLHFVFFHSIIFKFNPLIRPTHTEIAFLGAILDPFEIEKIKSQRSLSPVVPTNLTKIPEPPSRAMTAPAKPNMTNDMKMNDSKVIFRERIQVPAKAQTKNSKEDNLIEKDFSIKPYKKLRLYQ